MKKKDNYSLYYWFMKSETNERRCMLWQTVATVSLTFNGSLIGAVIAALIFR